MNPMQPSNLLVARLIDVFRKGFGPSAFLASENALKQLSGFAAAAAALMGFGLAMFAAIKTDALSLMLLGVGWIVMVAVLHFIGSRMLVSCAVTLRNTPSNVSSQDYLEVLGLSCIVVFIGALLGGLYLAIKLSTMTPLWYGLGGAITMLFFASMYLNPSLINTKVHASASAGEDAVAVSVLTLKTFVRLAPVVFAVLTLAGAGALGYGLVQLAKEGADEVMMGGLASISGFGIVALGLLYPLGAYLSFVLGYLLLDIARSILSLPRLLQPAGEAVDPAPSSDTGSTADIAEASPAQTASLKLMAALVGAVLVLGVIGVQGKTFYTEYQEKRAIAKMEEERVAAEKKAEEERLQAEQERQKAEAARIAKMAAAVTALKGKDAIDLVVSPDVSEAIKAMLPNQQSAYERYFAVGQPVEVQDGFAVATGCMTDGCGSNEGILVVDTKTGTVHAAVYFNQQVKFLGSDSASSAPAPIRKWALKFQ